MTTELSDSELRYRRLFETARDGILIVDPETRKIIDVNPFLAEFLGYTAWEFIGKELFEIGLLRDEAASQAAFRELTATGYIRYENLPLETKDGRHAEVEFVSNLYLEGKRPIIQCNVRDITERKKMERALRTAEETLVRRAAELEETVNQRTAELRTSNGQLEAFAHSIAHDLRAPLRTMQGFSQLLLQDHAENLNEQGRDFARFIDTAARTMDRLLADLLAFGQISQQKIELGPVSPGVVVQDALADCDAEIVARKARITSMARWPTVTAHPAILRQVLVQLIGNAVKFVEGRTPQVRLSAEERPGGIVRLRVEDNGIGIPGEYHQRIFQVFQRLHTTAYAGTGIGLAIVEKGVERMGGRVGVESTPGTGSKFWIDLPRAPETPRAPPGRKERL